MFNLSSYFPIFLFLRRPTQTLESLVSSLFLSLFFYKIETVHQTKPHWLDLTVYSVFIFHFTLYLISSPFSLLRFSPQKKKGRKRSFHPFLPSHSSSVLSSCCIISHRRIISYTVYHTCCSFHFHFFPFSRFIF